MPRGENQIFLIITNKNRTCSINWRTLSSDSRIHRSKRR